MDTNGHEAAPIEALLGLRILAHGLVNPGAACLCVRTHADRPPWGQGTPAVIRGASCPFVVELNGWLRLTAVRFRDRFAC